MKFQIGGKSYDLDEDLILRTTKGETPNVTDGRNKHYVELHGRSYPIKQVIHLATGLPHITFTAGHAHRILSVLGFHVFQQTSLNTEPPKGHHRDRDTLSLAVVLERDEDGYIVASCPALPGCHSQGKTREEALSNIREAMRGYLASMRKHGESLPSGVTVEEVEVAV